MRLLTHGHMAPGTYGHVGMWAHGHMHTWANGVLYIIIRRLNHARSGNHLRSGSRPRSGNRAEAKQLKLPHEKCHFKVSGCRCANDKTRIQSQKW